ncbi:MAG: hypothetical protein A2Y34_14620 [Spirochaetes bacterium GWC1_27_15]|nr:MAG: hypothetical protein A2Z98_11800 [Spirochaetes bacterium GWB1_27_13]OHD27893.1 MAG: hypothetical protein A2Y34_14620 [Spirochaetes bacterium GWC1_27_15]
MKHFLLFYLFLVFSLGVGTIIFSFIVYLKTKNKFTLSFLIFYIGFSLRVISMLFDMYAENINLISNIRIIIIYLNILSYFLLIFFIPFLCNAISEKNKIIENIFFASLVIISQILNFYFLSFEILDNHIEVTIKNKIGMEILNYIFVMVNIYSLIIGIKNYINSKNKVIKKLLKRLLIAFAVFIPAILMDVFGWQFAKNVLKLNLIYIPLHPLLYLTQGIIFIIFTAKQYILDITITNDLNKDKKQTFDKYNISGREQEIVDLILKGLANKEIANQLFISENTVKTHIKNIYEKIGIKNRYSLIVLIKNSSLSN